MMISTRGRYALRVMIDLAEHFNGDPTPLKEISLRQEISQKYLESIMVSLSKAGLVDGQHGKGGGYKLTKVPEDYSVGEVLRITEGSLAPIACLDANANPCARASECRTLPMWQKLDNMINDFFDGIKLSDFLNKSGGDYII